MKNSTLNQLTNTQPEHVTTLPGRVRDRIRLVKRFPGLQATVARSLELKGGTSGVNHVVHKRAKSARIEQSIIEEMNRRIDEEYYRDCAAPAA